MTKALYGGHTHFLCYHWSRADGHMYSLCYHWPRADLETREQMGRGERNTPNTISRILPTPSLMYPCLPRMMTSLDLSGNIFRVTGSLCGEFTGNR